MVFEFPIRCLNFLSADKTLEVSENLPEPDVLAQEIIDDLEDALMQLRNVGSELR